MQLLGGAGPPTVPSLPHSRGKSSEQLQPRCPFPGWSTVSFFF
uniref:Uncharacterized protein n=1 Tax=Macaca fascicularis TaxID=9541 RepID=A0A7N9DC34_MACFA